MRLEFAGNFERVEAAGGTFNGLVHAVSDGRGLARGETNLVCGVHVERGFDVLRSSDLACKTHALPFTLVRQQKRRDGIIKLARRDRVPCSQKHNVYPAY